MSDFYKLKTIKNGKEYILNACTQDTEQDITGTKNFSKLTVNSKNVVTSINGVSPSEDGNVNVTVNSRYMPDYTTGVSLARNTNHVAPCDCLVCVSAYNGSADISVLNTKASAHVDSDSYSATSLPVPKGATFYVNYPSGDSRSSYAYYYPFK